MNILGINFGHDAAVTLIKNGKIAFSIEEEKISRVKQDLGWPSQAIETCLTHNGLEPRDINVIAFGSLHYKELGASEIKFRFSKSKFDKWQEYLSRILAYYGIASNRFSDRNKDVFIENIRAKGFNNAKIVFYNHHLSHAISAWYCSPFQPDVVITCDGHGDGESFNFYRFEEATGLVPIKINDYKTSIGAFYSAVTEMLGFRPTRHEGKITGLAAFGRVTPLVDQFYGLFKLNKGNLLERFPFEEVGKYWDEYKIDKNLSTVNRINMITSEGPVGTDYSKRYIALLEHIKKLSQEYSKEDIAFAAQNVSEKVILEEIQRVLNSSYDKKKISIALAGGVFANVRINQKIYESDQVSNIFIQPAMGDSGLSLGAAISADIEFNHQKKDTTQYRFKDTYLGPDYSDNLLSFIQRIDHSYHTEKMEDAPKTIAQLLKDNLIVGFWHGNMEWGPRALGKRSMILNTFDKNVNDSLNKRLNRTEFMPFAPSVIDFMVKKYMPKYDPTCPAGDYMTITYDVAPEFHNLLQAVVHVDGTARPQVVKEETNPYFYKIIEEFYALTGCGAIVNTSFNVHEEPIVSTPESAFNALRDDRIDVLILDDYLLRKISK